MLALSACLVDRLERLGEDGLLLLGARRLVEPAPVDENAHVRDAAILELCPMGLEGADDEPGQHHRQLHRLVVPQVELVEVELRHAAQQLEGRLSEPAHRATECGAPLTQGHLRQRGGHGAHFGATIVSRSAPLVYLFSPYWWPSKKASGSAGAGRASLSHCLRPCLPRSRTCGQSLETESLDTLIIIASRYSNDGQPLSW